MKIEIELEDFRYLDDAYKKAIEIYKEKATKLRNQKRGFYGDDFQFNNGIVRLKEIKVVNTYRRQEMIAVFEITSEKD